jgi:hypothetical protein
MKQLGSLLVMTQVEVRDCHKVQVIEQGGVQLKRHPIAFDSTFCVRLLEQFLALFHEDIGLGVFPPDAFLGQRGHIQFRPARLFAGAAFAGSGLRGLVGQGQCGLLVADE